MKPSEVKPGDRFGLLTVQSIQQHYWKGKKDGFEAICLCDCGNQKTVTLSSLVRDHTKSCGCLKKQAAYNNVKYANSYLASHPEIRQENGRKTGSENIKHAHSYLSSHPEIRQEIGCKTGPENIKHANFYLDFHPEIRQEIGRKTGPKNIMRINSLPEIRQQNIRNSESSLQREYRLFLEQNNFHYEPEFFLDNHYFDFKVNNFLIEINGDIYHSSKYENLSNPSASGPSVRYKSQDYHKSILDLATSHGYRLIQLWEHNSFGFNSSLLFSQLNNIVNIDDYVEYINNQKVICNDYGFLVKGEYLPDSGRWVSTNYKEVVNESYSKGKVLVYNSGYTILQ